MWLIVVEEVRREIRSLGSNEPTFLGINIVIMEVIIKAEKKDLFTIFFFVTIEPNLMCLTFHGWQILIIVPSMNSMHLSNFDNFWAKTGSLLQCGPLDLISNAMANAWWDKQNIII
jgi:hypothetical protein